MEGVGGSISAGDRDRLQKTMKALIGVERQRAAAAAATYRLRLSKLFGLEIPMELLVVEGGDDACKIS